MKTLSICMIVKDEEATLERCLTCAAQIADEIVIVDTGSADRSEEIARAFTRNVFRIPWEEDFAKARNESFLHATRDYVMWLDADDVIEPDDIRKFLGLKQFLTDEDVVFCPYHTGFDGAGNPTFTFYRERIFRRESRPVWEGRVHECVAPKGKLYYADAAVCHRKCKPRDPQRNLLILRDLVHSGTASPRDRYYYARELFSNGELAAASEQLKIFLSAEGIWNVNAVEASLLLAECDRTLEPEQRLPHLLAALAFDVPSSELCCALGEVFWERGLTDRAAFWYRTALEHPTDPARGGFVDRRYSGIIPLLQLCVIEDRMGHLETAEDYNRRAAELEPDHPSVLYNLAYFASRKGLPPS